MAHMGTDEIDGAKQFIDYLNVKGIPHLYVTNNSTKTPEQVTENYVKCTLMLNQKRL